MSAGESINLGRPRVTIREEWLVARKELLALEKEHTRQRDALNAARRRLPMVRVEKPYVFEGPAGDADASFEKRVSSGIAPRGTAIRRNDSRSFSITGPIALSPTRSNATVESPRCGIVSEYSSRTGRPVAS